MVDLSKYILDASTLVLSLCVVAVPITRGVAAILPRSLYGVCRQLASPFENFLTLEDLQETPGNIDDVSKSKTQILVASACLVSISSLVSLVLQLSSGDPQSTLHAIVLFVAWFYISFRTGIKTFKTPPYDFIIFASLYAFRSGIQLGLTLIADEIKWIGVAWLSVDLLFAATFIYVAGTYPLTKTLPCEYVATADDVPSNTLSCPEDRVTLWSWCTFTFVQPLLELASKRTLGETDVWTLSPYFRHRNLFNKRLEYQSRYPTHSLLRFLIASNSLDLILDYVLELWSAVIGFVPAYAVKEILAVLVENTPKARRTAYIWTTIAFLANLSFAQVDLFQAWHTRRCYERTRGQLFCAIHYKALKRRDTNCKSSTAGKEKSSELGRILNIMRGDSYAVAQRFWDFSAVFAAPVRLTIAVVFLYKVLGWSSLVSVAVVSIAWLFNYPLIQWNVRFARSMLQAMDKRLNTVDELLQNIRFLKLYGWENHWSSRAQDARDDELCWRVRSYILETVMSFIWIWTPSATALVAFLCYTLVEGQKLTVSKAFTALSLFSYVQGPMAALPGQVEALIKAYVSMQRIEAFLSEDEVPDWASTLSCSSSNLPAATESLGFHQAVFQWENPEDASPSRFRLGPLDLVFPSKGLTLVRGATGSGKTALLSALLGEMHCISGSVLINKTQHRIAYCGQNPWLEHASIRDNIVFDSTYGYDKARYEKVVEACALLPDFRILPNGDLTEIGEKGITLSGGQRSRIALARAMYSQAQYILLDDPLAAVDTHTAQHIVHECFTGSLAKNRGIILVTHHSNLCLPVASYVVDLVVGQIHQHGANVTVNQSVAEEIAPVERRQNANDSSPTLYIPELGVADKGSSGTATPAYSDGSESTSVGVKLIEEEARAEGRVSMRVYLTYIRAAGVVCWILTLLLMLLIRLINIGDQLFLAKWGEAYERNDMPSIFFFFRSQAVHQFSSFPRLSLPSPDVNVVPWLMIYLWISTAGAISLLLNQSLGYYASLRAGRALFSSLLRRITRAQLRFFDTTPIGRIHNRFTSDIGTIDGALQNSGKACISGFMDFMASFITILVVVPKFSPFALFIAWLYMRLAPSYIRTSRDLRRLESVALSPTFSGFDELLKGITHIRAFGMEQNYQDRFYGKVDHFQTFDHVYWLINGWLRWRYDCLGSVVVFVATLFALHGGITDGLTAVVMTQAAQFAEANRLLVKVAAQLELDFNSVERVTEYLGVPQEAPAIIENSRPPAYWPSSSGELVVDGLVVQYAPHLPPALKDASFTVKPAEKVGVIGRTGSGKSTLALSLLRMVEPTAGKIMIDGIDIATLGLEDLRTRVTIISQDVSIFPGTIRSNLDPLDQHTSEECMEVVDRCHLNAKLRFTPTAEESTILDMKIKPGSLSAGENQLVALARAILRRTNIIIMDEATSQIDGQLDEQIQQTIRQELAGSIVITIAHRLKTIIDYDRILVLDHGAVVEFDSPKSLLLDSQSRFRQLCQKSADWPWFSSLLGDNDSAFRALMAATTAFAGSWASLQTPLTPWILDVIQCMGYQQLTPVQASTIPLFMKNKDVVVEAVTGSGKTLAFVIPTLERLIRRDSRLRRNEVGALIISPTRELASQIHSVFSLFLDSQPGLEEFNNNSPEGSQVPQTKFRYPSSLLLVSSNQSTPAQDLERFLSSGADIVIGTPGRVEEFLLGRGRNTVSTKELEILVLDEADRLLDLGFQDVLGRIITHLPKQRRTGLFSATMTDADAMTELVRVGLRNPARVVVKVQAKKAKGESLIEERRIPAHLQNFYISCYTSEKLLQLSRLISYEVSKNKASSLIVYFATCACVDYFYKVLPSVSLPSITFYSLHGHLPPSARTKTLHNFASAPSTPTHPSVLLATDVAARGLDLPNVDVVIQFDPPSDPKAFSHRCGRTARAGRSGRAYVLLVGRELQLVEFMSIRKIPLKQHAFIQQDLSLSNKDDTERLTDMEVDQAFSLVRTKVLTDRAYNDQAMKAFVSFVRAYSKHEASYIFRIKDLDLVGVAKSFGLLRLPRMPELRNVDTNEWVDAVIDWDNYSYADKAQEAKRLAANEAEKKSPENDKNQNVERAKKRKANVAWSEQTTKKEEREKRREKRVKKKKWLKDQQRSVSTVTSENKPSKVAAMDISDEDDWDDLAKEERMAKKLRKGRISQKEFDAAFDDL